MQRLSQHSLSCTSRLGALLSTQAKGERCYNQEISDKEAAFKTVSFSQSRSGRNDASHSDAVCRLGCQGKAGVHCAAEKMTKEITIWKDSV